MNPQKTNLLFEHDWLQRLEELSAKVGEDEIYVRYVFPDGRLDAIGFPPSVDERWIVIPLQSGSHKGSPGAVLRLHLPLEDEAQYRQHEDENGEMYLSVAYLDRPLEGRQVTRLELATKPELLDSAVNAPPIQ